MVFFFFNLSFGDMDALNSDFFVSHAFGGMVKGI